MGAIIGIPVENPQDEPDELPTGGGTDLESLVTGLQDVHVKAGEQQVTAMKAAANEGVRRQMKTRYLSMTRLLAGMTEPPPQPVEDLVVTPEPEVDDGPKFTGPFPPPIGGT